MFSSIIGTETKLNPETLSAAGCCGVEQDTRRDRDRKMAGEGGAADPPDTALTPTPAYLVEWPSLVLILLCT